MDRHLSRVGGILGLVESNNAADRRKFLQELHNVYADESCVEAINAQTAKDSKSATSWNQIMLAVHRFSLTEAEKSLGRHSSGSSATIAQSGCSSLMLKTVSLAVGTDTVSLDPDDLMAIFFQVWGNNVYRLYHDTYMNILVHHVLANEAYRLRITAEQWREILRLSIDMYTESSNTFKSILLDTMRLVVQYGCPRSHLLLDVKKILPFLEKLFQDIGTGKEFMLRQLYKLTYTVGLEIGTESRIALCKFSENSLSPIICLEGCPEMYKMLLLLVQIHHPGGVTCPVNDDNDNAAYAHDWNKWRNIIRGIYGNIMGNIKSEKLEPCLLNLCCEVYRQILQDPAYLAEASLSHAVTQDEHPRKVRRLTVERPIDMLLMKNDLHVAWPFIQILTVFLRKYPENLNSNDYLAFLKIVTRLLGKSFDNEMILGSLCELSTVLVRLERERCIEAEEIESVRVCWQQIWEMVTRASSMNKNRVPCHELLQSMIQHASVTNPHAFLRLYLKRAIGWSSSSIETLLRFFTHVPIPASEYSNPRDSESTTRGSLLQWALDIPSSTLSTDVPTVCLGKLLTSLAVKSSYKRESRLFDNDDDRDAEESNIERELLDDRESKASRDIESCHLSLIFRLDIFDDAVQSKITDGTKVTATHEIVGGIFEALVDTLSDSLANPLNDNNRKMSMRITRANVAAEVISNLAALDVEFEGDAMSKLVGAFGEAYKNILSTLVTLEITASSPHQPGKEEPIVAFERLYCTRYHSKVEKIILELTSMDFIKYISKLVENWEKCKVNRKKDACRVRKSADKIITYFCCVRNGERVSACQMMVLEKIMKNLAGSRCTTSYYYGGCIRRALRFLAVFILSDRASRSSSDSGSSSSSKDSLEMTIAFVERLLKLQGQDERVVRGVLKVVPRFTKVALATESTRSIDLLASILSEINKCLANENYGPLVHVEFLKCLAQLIRLDPLLKWQIGKSREPILQHLIKYIGSPFYVVRLQVVRALYVAFSSKQLDIGWKANFLEKVVSAVKSLFGTGNLSGDELVTRQITAVHVIAAVIRGNVSRQLHGQALLAIIQLSVERGIEATMIKRALVLSARKSDEEGKERLWPRRLVEMNMHKLLSRWLEADYPLERFPWILTDCDSHENFTRRYIETLVTIKLQRLEFDDLVILCNNLEISFAQTIENSFAPIMSLLLSMCYPTSRPDEVHVVKYARKKHESLRNIAGVFSDLRSFGDLLEDKLDQIVVDIVRKLYDQQHFNTIFETNSVSLPSFVNQPHFNRDTVEHCLRLLEKDLSLEKDSLIEYLVTQRPSVLQKILLTLVSDIYEAKFTDYDLLVFYRYAYLCTSVIEKLSKAYFDPMSLYVVRDISHSLLCFIKDETFLSEMACTYFEKFLCFALPTRATEIKEILSFTVSSLIPIVQTGRVNGAIALLRYLIVQQSHVLAEAIEKLDSFPYEEAFNEIRQVHNGLKYGTNRVYSLEQEIEHFLNATNEKTLSCSYEGLSRLTDQLSTRKNELRELYRKLERLRGFAEDCASSTLHRLIYKLVQLTKLSNADISLEAAKSLGELGPADLTTIILHPEKGYGRVRDNSAEGRVEILTLNVISHLSEYLVDSDVDLRIASADALYAVFSTDWSRKFTEKCYLNETLMLLCGIDNSKLYNCVYPFVASFDRDGSAAHMPIRIDDDNLEILINRSNDLWIPRKYDTYPKWITEITLRILDCFLNLYAKGLKPVCKRSIEFSEMLFPRLVDLLIGTKKSLVNELCGCINRFFGYLFESLGETQNIILSVTSDSPIKSNDISRSHECVRSMLSVVNFMRIHSIDSNTPLALEYLFIAKAADYNSAYFTSLLYAELACQTLVKRLGFDDEILPGNWISAIDSICECDPSSGRLLQYIVREAYLHIGDPDSIYGCGLPHLSDSSFRAQHYTHLRQWDKVILEQDMELTCSSNGTRRDMLNALRQSGHQYLVGLVINMGNGEADNVDDFMYEAAWRLADWGPLESHRDVAESVKQSLSISHGRDYHASHYRALECLRDGNVLGLSNALANARACIVKSLRKTTLECCQTVYPILSQLQMLEEIEEFAAEMNKVDKYNQLLDKWNQQDFANTHDFQYVESILSQRLAMYQIRKSGGDDTAIMNLALIDAHLKIAQVAEKQGYLSIASRALDTLAEKIDLSDGAQHQLTFQKALLAWKEGERNISRYLLRDLIKRPTLDASLRAKALRTCGNWMAETKCEKPQAIIKSYYNESIRINLEMEVPSSSDVETLTDAQADLGQFADAQYQQIIRFAKSAQYENLVKCSKDDDNGQGTSDGTVSFDNTDETEAIITYRQQVNDDASELEDIKREKDMYLILAAKNYLLTLQNGNDHDLLVFRLVSLWLENSFHEELNKILDENLSRVASYKFITLLCQVAPHMSNVTNDLTMKVKDLMMRCAEEHPHHTLPVLFALRNTYKDEEFQQTERGSQKNSKTRPEPRVIAADALISQLMHCEIRPIIQEINQLSHALIMLANLKVPPNQAKKIGVPHDIPRNQAIMKIRNFHHTIVPTITLNVSPSGNYDTIVGIREYDAKFELPGGLNAPKKVICAGTDGIRRRQLVKGLDDLRQDAVMQQVCTVMNSMLKASRESKRRRLHIRTYKIVPLSQRSGVLEWCENTLPISHVLTDIGGKLGMHTKYYPNDWSVTKCRSKLQAVKDQQRHVKLATFLECCKNLHPAFHHFFMEKYPSAETWFERRLAYVRSVATTSMIGYMLGLGDRHFSNILIDQTTAEVIHIDFGIAFAQGKVLPVPETVPFRLTRDMEVAMGISGVEGVMRRSCEVTVAVLRDRRKTLITVLQVLLYDPLFSWSITPVKTNDLQTCNSRFTRGPTHDQDKKKTNEIAEKALLRIDEKLQGTADGLILSISGQVERLIQQARDPANLCRIFSGWQPYL